MKYLLLVSHSTFAQGIEDALNMLLGTRAFVLSCGMEEGTSVQEYRAQFAEVIEPLTSSDHIVLLADMGGGSPVKTALAVIESRGLAQNVVAFGGANLPMAISAVMGIEDELDMDAIGDALLADGAQAVRQL